MTSTVGLKIPTMFHKCMNYTGIDQHIFVNTIPNGSNCNGSYNSSLLQKEFKINCNKKDYDMKYPTVLENRV